MECHIYRSSVREGLYVYLADKDALTSLPDPVLQQLGKAEFAMTIELTEDSQLNQENSREVLDNLARQGYHVQMPRDIESILADIASESLARSQQK